MKTYIYKLLTFFFLLFYALGAYAQNNINNSKLKIFGRFSDNNSVEIRYFPADKLTLAQGLVSGYIIERADGNSDNFVEIANVKQMTSKEWDQLIAKEANADAKEELSMVKEFTDELINGGVDRNIVNQGLQKIINENKKQNFAVIGVIMVALKNSDAMNALGLRFFDKNVDKNAKYKYRVKINKKNIYSSFVEVSSATKQTISKEVMEIRKGDAELGFKWQINRKVFGYDVEKSIAGANDFSVVNKARILKLRRKGDTLNVLGFVVKELENYKKYTFRLFGYNVFGERVLIDEQTSFSIDLTPPSVPILKKPVQTKPNEVLIEWEMNDKPSDLKGFVVSRGKSNKGIFTVLNKGIIDKNTYKFVDSSFDKDSQNYYVVSALDTIGNMSTTNPIPVIIFDTIPPKKPLIKSVLIDSLGVTKIVVKENSAKDLMGYKLYRANNIKSEFTPIKDFFKDNKDDLVQTVFKDTIVLKTLDKNVYYKVKALDFHYNQSEFSDVYTVKRPDIVPPTSPVFKKIKTFEDHIELSFALSQSNDVKGQYLYKKLQEDKEWTKIATLKKDQKLYIDNNVKAGSVYYYTLRAVDESGLFSEYALAVFGSPIDNGLIPVIQDFSIKQNNRYIKLSWKYQSKEKGVFFVVFKQMPNGKLKEIKRTSKRYIEDGLKSKGTYRYAVKVYSNDGKQSMLSNFKEVSL